MTPYEHMVKFEMALEMGLLTLDELRQFLSENIRGSDVPYIYTAVFLSLDKGQEEVIDTIFYNLQGNYTADRSEGNTVERMLIGVIRDKLKRGEIDTAECVEYLQKLTDYFECGWNMLAIGEYYRLNQGGYYSDIEFASMLNGILEQGI